MFRVAGAERAAAAQFGDKRPGDLPKVVRQRAGTEPEPVESRRLFPVEQQVRQFAGSAGDDRAVRSEVGAVQVVEPPLARLGGPRPPLQVYADLAVFIDEAPGAAAARQRRLDDLDGAEFATDCAIVAGTAGELADLLLGWRQAGLDGFRLRPGALPHDLRQITGALVPELRRRGAFRAGYAEHTLRERLGLSRPANRYGASRYQIGAA